MGSKHKKCCCCPNCTIRVEQCCPCVCPAICVTFTPDDYEECEVERVEIDWDDYLQGYSGELAGYDLFFYFERDAPEYGKERGPCTLKLRSDALEYPEGGEYTWYIPCEYEHTPEVDCTSCSAMRVTFPAPGLPYQDCSVGRFDVECVPWITPVECDNCHCLCECLCVNVYQDRKTFTGKACWDEYEQAYKGTLSTSVLGAYDYAELEVSFPIRRWGEVCSESDPTCDPYSTECAIGFSYKGTGVDDVWSEISWKKMTEPCELRAVDYEWGIENDPYTDDDDVRATIYCARCGDDCVERVSVGCCDEPIATVLHATFYYMRLCTGPAPASPPPWKVYGVYTTNITLTYNPTTRQWFGWNYLPGYGDGLWCVNLVSNGCDLCLVWSHPSTEQGCPRIPSWVEFAIKPTDVECMNLGDFTDAECESFVFELPPQGTADASTEYTPWGQAPFGSEPLAPGQGICCTPYMLWAHGGGYNYSSEGPIWGNCFSMWQVMITE